VLIQLPNLSFAKFRFTLEALETLFLPEYKGSTLRGGFGHAFRKLVCTMGPIPCHTCLLQLKCPYPQFFETPIVGDTPPFMRGVKTGPQPFVLEPPLETKRVYQKGELLEFGLLLMGRAIEFLPYFIFTFAQLGYRGIGRGQKKFHLKEVAGLNLEEWQPIYRGDTKTLTADYQTLSTPSFAAPADGIERLTLRFLTPTRIKIQGHLSTAINFRELVLWLLRRICTLAYFHMPGSTVEWNWRTALNAAKEVVVESKELRWVDWERYSNRQESRMKLGGFVGEITVCGEMEQWLPLLKLGEAVHVGKGATFGLGKYEIPQKT